jgi:hypothetical protein
MTERTKAARTGAAKKKIRAAAKAVLFTSEV